jgi:hypothetical protein
LTVSTLASFQVGILPVSLYAAPFDEHTFAKFELADQMGRDESVLRAGLEIVFDAPQKAESTLKYFQISDDWVQ